MRDLNTLVSQSTIFLSIDPDRGSYIRQKMLNTHPTIHQIVENGRAGTVFPGTIFHGDVFPVYLSSGVFLSGSFYFHGTFFRR